jgi:hypothetical protein
VSRPWGGRWLGLDHLLAECALAHLAASFLRCLKKVEIFSISKIVSIKKKLSPVRKPAKELYDKIVDYFQNNKSGTAQGGFEFTEGTSTK